jgi:hypothetical protein
MLTLHWNSAYDYDGECLTLSFLRKLRYSSGAPDRRIEVPVRVRFLLDKYNIGVAS